METVGRAGMATSNQIRTPSRDENRQDEGHVPCGRARALTRIECHLEGFPHGGEEVETSLLPPHYTPAPFGRSPPTC